MLTALHAPSMITPLLLLHELRSALHAPFLIAPLLFWQELVEPLMHPPIIFPAIGIVWFRGERRGI